MLCGQLYYPVEHAAWAADQGLIPLHSSSAWTAAMLLWGVPLLVTSIQQLVKLVHINASISDQNLESYKTQLQSTVTSPHLLHELRKERVKTLLNLVRSACDLALAVFWLPEGWLWGGKLPASIWGSLGTISSLLGLYLKIKSKQALGANKAA